MDSKDHQNDSEPLVVYASRGKAGLTFVGSLVFVALGIWIGMISDQRGLPFWKTLIASYLGVPFFTVGTLYSAYRLLVPKAVVTADTTGLTDSASLAGMGHLFWEEIDYVMPYQFSGQWMLGIVPYDLPALLERCNGLQRRIIEMNVALGCAAFNIPQAVIPMTVHELAELLHARFGVHVIMPEDT